MSLVVSGVGLCQERAAGGVALCWSRCRGGPDPQQQSGAEKDRKRV